MEREPMFNGQWYKYAFSIAPLDALCLDVTPAYSILPDKGVEFVAKFLPKTKFIFIVRSPVERALSQLRMDASRSKNIPKNEDEWIALFNKRRNDIIIRSDYIGNISRWQNAFNPDRLLFIPFGLIGQAPQAFLSEIEKFLILPAVRYPGSEEKVFKTRPINIPRVVEQELRHALKDQVDFLRARFGDDFFQMSR